MPIYEYQCKACGAELEKLQKLSDAPLVDCPQCKQPELKKKISAAGFRLSGSGWYETDFKKGSDKKKNLVDSGASADKTEKSAGESSASDKPSSSEKKSTDKKDSAKSNDQKSKSGSGKP